MSGRIVGERARDVYAFLLARVKLELDRKKLTIGDLATSSRIEAARLDAILNGRAREVTLQELAAISCALDVPVADLLSPGD